MTNKESLILIDGSFFLYRSFHALPSLVTSTGFPTGAIYGVINIINKILTLYPYNYVGITFDTSKKTFRHILYPQYKANRPLMPEELKIQLHTLQNIIKLMGIKLLIFDGIEADDVIGTISKIANNMNINTIIATGDKDMVQLINQNIVLLDTISNTIIDIDTAISKFGVLPEQMVDYLTLVGDKSDNIYGIPMIGPKTAKKLLNEYETLDNIIKNSENIRGKIGHNLRTFTKNIDLTKKLLTIDNFLCLPIILEDLIRKKIKFDELIPIFENLEFKNWAQNLSIEYSKTSKKNILINQKNIISNKQGWIDLYNMFTMSTQFAFVVLTKEGKLIGIAFKFNIAGHNEVYVPMTEICNTTSCINKLRTIFNDSSKIKLGYNIKYAINIFSEYDINIQNLYYDTMVESHILCNSEIQRSKFQYIGKKIDFGNLQLYELARYAINDAQIIFDQHNKFSENISNDKNIAEIFKNIEMPLIHILAEIERRGINIDRDYLLKYSNDIQDKLQRLSENIYNVVGTKFNINSPLQLSNILYNQLQLPILKKTSTKKPSTNEEVLNKLKDKSNLPALILKYRNLSKLKSTYTDALCSQINPITGRIHTSYNQAITITGRVSSVKPNVQNIPIRTPTGRKIRKAFISTKGYKIISADYSQIELRILAQLSKDKQLIKLFQSGKDIHTLVASEIFKINIDQVTISERREAKIINFGLIYGMTSFGLSKKLDCVSNIAKQYMDSYFERYSGILDYLKNIREFVHANGYVETAFGRRIYISNIKSKDFYKIRAAERTAINASIQGTAADIIKIAMINIDSWIKQNKINIFMIMQIHDELVFEVEEKHVEYAVLKIREIMEKVVYFDIPMIVKIGVGDNWDDSQCTMH